MKAFFDKAKRKIEAEIAAITGDDDEPRPAPPPPVPTDSRPPYQQGQPQGFERAVFAHFMVSRLSAIETLRGLADTATVE